MTGEAGVQPAERTGLNMAELTERRGGTQVRGRAEESGLLASNQAFRILHFAFVVAPTLMGLDKFFNVLTHWTNYVAPPFARMMPFPAETFMMVVGVVEIVAGLIVLLKPKIGAVIVAIWLALIIINLVVLSASTGRPYYDIALRDLGLFLGAIALSRLASAHDSLSESAKSASSER
jgi:hypothetical protein